MNVRKPTPRALAATLGALTLAGVVSASAVHPRGTTTAESMPDGVAAAAGGRAGARDPEFRNVAYDGRFTFARIRFTGRAAPSTTSPSRRRARGGGTRAAPT